MSSGLAINESKFFNSSRGRDVIGGPHRIFTLTHQNFKSTTSTFFTEQYLNVRKRQPLSSFLVFKEDHIKNLHQIEAPSIPDTQVHLSTTMRVFEEVEATGSEITYRCPQYRSCKVCKHESTNDLISVKEEIEQSIINSTVKIDRQTATSTATLPFIVDPVTRLANNKDKATIVYLQQIRKLNLPDNQKDKQFFYIYSIGFAFLAETLILNFRL